MLHLTTGGMIEGKILEETATEIKIETAFGIQTFARSRIRDIEHKEAPQDEIARRRRALAAEDADGRYHLALFCKEKNFKRLWKELLEEAVAIDVHHQGAQEALGRVLYKDRWVSPKDKERLEKEDARKEKEARGLVEYDGRWVTPEEKANLEKGLVLHEGEWMTPDAAKRAQGYEKVGDLWVLARDLPLYEEREHLQSLVGHDLQISVRGNVCVVTDLGQTEADETANTAQRATEAFCSEFGHEPNDLSWLGEGKALLVTLRGREAYHALVDEARRYRRVDRTWEKITKNTYGFYFWDPTGLSVSWQGERRRGAARGQALHQLGHILINRHRYDFKILPPWLDEGFASLFEFEAHGRNDVYCVSRQGYLSGGTAALHRKRGDWRSKLESAIRDRQDTSLESLVRRELNELSEIDIAKAMGTIEVIRQTEDLFVRFCEALRREWPKQTKPGHHTAVEAHAKIFRELLGKEPGAYDTDVRKAFGGS